MRQLFLTLTIFLLLLSACQSAMPASLPAVTASAAAKVAAATPLPAVTATVSQPATTTATAVPTQLPTPTVTATPFFTGTPSAACGQRMPLITTGTPSSINQLNPTEAQLTALKKLIPTSAWPAMSYILTNPEDVGLVVHTPGKSNSTLSLNGEQSMPLASIFKLLHLIAYAEAVAANELDPREEIPLSILENYYQPGLDLNAHALAVTNAKNRGVVSGSPESVPLSEIPRMMIQHSSNAATDYLHFRLGQERIEQTALSFGLTSHTAPCPFIAQFLAMNNVSRGGGSDRIALVDYLQNPTSYGEDAMLFADAYTQHEAFRDAQISWRQRTRRPSVSIQSYFSENLSPQASAADYAILLQAIAENGLSNDESSFIARQYLEWPMFIESNQRLFTNLGFKNGSLPGILNIVYYAYPHGESRPTIVILFVRRMPQNQYRQWRRNLPHDALAHNLLHNPEAIALLAQIIAASP